MNIEALSAEFKVSPGTVRGWIRRGMPVEIAGDRGRSYEIDLEQAREFYRVEILKDLTFADFDLTGAIEGLTN